MGTFSIGVPGFLMGVGLCWVLRDKNFYVTPACDSDPKFQKYFKEHGP